MSQFFHDDDHDNDYTKALAKPQVFSESCNDTNAGHQLFFLFQQCSHRFLLKGHKE